MDEYRCKQLPEYEIARRNEVPSAEYGIPLHLPVPMPYEEVPVSDPTDKGEGGIVIDIGEGSIDGVVIIDMNNL